MNVRRFPPPWSVEEQKACFVVGDHSGQQLAYVYFEDEPGRRSAARLLPGVMPLLLQSGNKLTRPVTVVPA